MAPQKGCIPWNKGKKCPQLSQALKGNKNCLGRTISKKTKKKLSISNTGKKHSEETKKKISRNSAMRGKTGELHQFFGKNHTQESKEKNRLAHLGKKHSEKTKEKMKQSWSYEKIITPDRNIKISESRKGMKFTKEHRKNIGLSKKGVFAGNKHPNWKGGTSSYQGGYVYELYDGKYQLQHRLVIEKHIGRKLLKSEVVHHKDKDRKNNNINNLELWDRSEHASMHSLQNWSQKCSTS